MPHFVMEYSANLDSDIDFPDLFEQLADVAQTTGVFPLGGIRIRAHRCEQFRVAEGDPENRFLQLSIKVGSGRTEDTLKDVGDTIHAFMTDYLASVFERHYLSFGLEITELHPTLNYKKNNIHQKLAK
ncbi:putative 5-carboxymethyl-2-hydroxymuconate isomerase [Vibrio nigripulchritudo SFn27]|uniref:Putative 5-carboxymethyl-2-hydroxymuconate isomerase n=1 Tax=Vibrio nigripulchritudo TaxID=28173 RepID=U4KEY6_9VIBR|nr:5-carboxymethyl-2-hydroxymuconate Delta-isomerase [Vibrio nigripulchritudo]CCN81018.1 putative 5-carboxymethyl-2-hydroxymuconate isomerase [Vibrio nigripulchritudo BLFn1]CCN87949.1 putative 5-carboxymethyl-2-hydroxymuconate isomerase [Vibrio nigripulchritudo SFn27]CCN96261.1 putative 5-carboxymethyl-2-hydroxymuconate isomerase [Vibrio nigripulchritudo ENn2]CCO42168.1 putative 5-carboxymethyl-2-hydroxymuconate isomerase [Vibrio nigripulchritudo SFn135]CCO55310.1 putative 5-carboxymethyl-2-hy